MRFIIWPSTARPWSEILELAQHCEGTGWDGVYLADHFMPHGDFTPDVDDTVALDGDKLECWSVLAALAAAVPRLRLGTLVSSVTFRHPAVIANIAAAVDNISGGRLVLGIGAGWQRNEHVAYGIELGTIPERLDRFEEACAVINSLLRERRTTFNGSYYRIADATNQPAPVQARLPLLIGGGGEKRTLRIVATYADEWNVWGTPETMVQKGAVLDEHCKAIGRDTTEIQRSAVALLFLNEDQATLERLRGMGIERPSVIGTVEQVRETMGGYVAAGVDEYIVPGFNFRSQAEREDSLDRFITEVAPAFR